MIEEVFASREKISLEDFQEIIQSVTSEMFLAVSGVCFLKDIFS